MGEVLYVCLVQGLRHAGHISRIVGSGARLEIAQLLHHVIILLPGDSRYFVFGQKKHLDDT